MTFQEPKVEFIRLELVDIITGDDSGNQSQVGQCGGNQNDDDCFGGAAWNY